MIGRRPGRLTMVTIPEAGGPPTRRGALRPARAPSDSPGRPSPPPVVAAQQAQRGRAGERADRDRSRYASSSSRRAAGGNGPSRSRTSIPVSGKACAGSSVSANGTSLRRRIFHAVLTAMDRRLSHPIDRILRRRPRADAARAWLDSGRASIHRPTSTGRPGRPLRGGKGDEFLGSSVISPPRARRRGCCPMWPRVSMTAGKNFKRRVRERARRTGESYTAALRHLRSSESTVEVSVVQWQRVEKTTHGSGSAWAAARQRRRRTSCSSRRWPGRSRSCRSRRPANPPGRSRTGIAHRRRAPARTPD